MRLVPKWAMPLLPSHRFTTWKCQPGSQQQCQGCVLQTHHSHISATGGTHNASGYGKEMVCVRDLA